ncbi:MAG: hypothetical protein RLZZ353_1380, partial [Actinomycetota bacterium]
MEAVDDLAGRDALLLGAYRDGGAVAVRARHHQDPVAGDAVVAGEDVGRQVRAGEVAEMQRTVGVGPGDGDEDVPRPSGRGRRGGRGGDHAGSLPRTALRLTGAALAAATLLPERTRADRLPRHEYAGPDGRFVRLRGVEVHHEVHGPEDAPVLLLSHHFYGAVRVW